MLRAIAGLKVAAICCCFLALAACSKKNTPDLEANGFGIVRTLAEREGLVFVEGLKPRTPVTP